jgi:hypothetical protein
MSSSGAFDDPATDAWCRPSFESTINADERSPPVVGSKASSTGWLSEYERRRCEEQAEIMTAPNL